MNNLRTEKEKTNDNDLKQLHLNAKNIVTNLNEYKIIITEIVNIINK